jgi:deoxyadenosine/deoxycytidine kinase
MEADNGEPEWIVYPPTQLGKRARGCLLVVEGAPGSGKTTFTKALAARLPRCLNIEVVGLSENMHQPLLEYFCEDPHQRAALTQLVMLEKRAFQMIEAAQAVARGALVIMDRSLPGDFAFALMHHGDGNMSDKEMAVYKDEREAALVKLQHLGAAKVTATLFLTVPTPMLKQRIIQRGDLKEVDLYCVRDPTYLDRLSTAYAATMQPRVTCAPVLRVPWLDDHPHFGLTDADCQALLTQLLDHAGGPVPAPEDANADETDEADGPTMTELFVPQPQKPFMSRLD